MSLDNFAMPLMSNIGPRDWAELVARQPRGHVLQLLEWAQLKDDFGWTGTKYAAFVPHGLGYFAVALKKKLPLGLGAMAYIPMGGYAPDQFHYEHMWQDISEDPSVAFLKIEPGHVTDDEGLDLRAMGFQPSPQTIQPPRTIIIDISGSEDEILARMNQGARRKIRKSLASDLRIRKGKFCDIKAFSALMDETGDRNGFGVHSREYYQAVFKKLIPRYGALWIAECKRQPLAAVIVLQLGDKAWYMYGASSREHPDMFASYGVQWRAIKWAKSRGCRTYDMWGVPDHDEAELEAQFQERRDGLWGVYGFKRGWGGQVRRTAGAWDLPFKPRIYRAYRAAIKAKELRFKSG